MNESTQALASNQRRCLLAASEMHLPKHLIYKLRRRTRLGCKLLGGGVGHGLWRASFMGYIVAAGNSFQEVIVKAQELIPKSRA